MPDDPNMGPTWASDESGELRRVRPRKSRLVDVPYDKTILRLRCLSVGPVGLGALVGLLIGNPVTDRETWALDDGRSERRLSRSPALGKDGGSAGLQEVIESLVGGYELPRSAPVHGVGPLVVDCRCGGTHRIDPTALRDAGESALASAPPSTRRAPVELDRRNVEPPADRDSVS